MKKNKKWLYTIVFITICSILFFSFATNTKIKFYVLNNEESLVKATKKGDIKEINELINKGTDVNISGIEKNSENIPPIIIAAVSNNSKILSLLIEKGANVNTILKGKDITLAEIETEREIKTIKLTNPTPLLAAVMGGNIENIKILLKNGADIDLKGGLGFTPLMLASFYGKIDIVEILLKNGANINLKDDRGVNALDYSIQEKKTDISKLLIKNGIEIGNVVEGKNNLNALSRSIVFKEYEVAKILVEKGADVYAKSSKNQTPLMFSLKQYSETGNDDLFFSIVEREKELKDINYRDNDGQTLLMFAVQYNDVKAVKYLLENGADKDIKTNDGLKAIDITDNEEIIKLLK